MYSNYGWCIHIYSVTTCPGCLVNKREREATRIRTQKVSILLFVFAFRSADFRLLNPLLVEWACWSDKSKPSDCRDVSQRVNLPRAPNSRSHLLLACLLTEAASEKKLSRVPYIPFILYSRKGHLSGTIYVCTSSSYEVRRYSGNQLRKVRPDFHMILSLPPPLSANQLRMHRPLYKTASAEVPQHTTRHTHRPFCIPSPVCLTAHAARLQYVHTLAPS